MSLTSSSPDAGESEANYSLSQTINAHKESSIYVPRVALPFHVYQTHIFSRRDFELRWWKQMLGFPTLLVNTAFVVTLVLGTFQWAYLLIGVRFAISLWMYVLFLRHLSATKRESPIYQKRLQRQIFSIIVCLFIPAVVFVATGAGSLSAILAATAIVSSVMSLFFAMTLESHDRWLVQAYTRYTMYRSYKFRNTFQSTSLTAGDVT